jgi:hypothetical protein
MYIVAIAWVYVTFMIAVTESSVIAGVLTFLFYGLAPLALFLWIFGTPARRRAMARRASAAEDTSDTVALDQMMDQHDASDAGGNEQHLLQRGGQFGTPVQAGDQVGDRDIDHAGGGDAQQVGHDAGHR